MASNESSTNNSSSSTATSSILPTQLHHFITIKLTKDNYLLWRAQLIPYLRGQNLFGYLDGSIPYTPITIPSSTNTSIHIPNPEYVHWSQQDQIILSAILSSLTESLLTQIIGLTTSRDVWLALEKTFSSTSSPRILSIRFQLSTLKKASLTITDYFTKVKHLSDTLSTISHPLSSSKITSYLLDGLPSSYDSLVTAITTRLDPISLDDLYGCLLTHENRLEQQTTSNEFNLPSANIATSYFGRGHRGSPSNRGAPHYGNQSRGRGRGFHNYSPHQMSQSNKPPCQICSKIGHTASTCWHRFNQQFQSPSTPHPQANIAQSHTPKYDQNWYPDTSATNHITSNLNNLSLNTDIYTGPDQIQVANGQGLKILHTGSSLLYSTLKSFFLNKSLHAPEIKKNLLSVSQFTKDNNVYFEFQPSFSCVKDPSSRAVLLKGPSKSGLYPLHTLTSRGEQG
ncbi:hypothetical protein Pint_25899 [Pistacia integerrima]|uniref:Uncharacterized protein n=1 Tax=Pistacia integerrima TaxID=434235 RepID=A0ACC0YEM7_9ROSI|nr:hypothetical protein Pint_25899 [Pistacia integerrima]